MNEDFEFLKPGTLVDGDLKLVLIKKTPAKPEIKHVPSYEFEMRRIRGQRSLGRISLRIGSAVRLRCPGHIGYNVNKRSRGKRYAARCCRLLFPLARAHGMKAVWITCAPANIASRRTCEIIGGKYIETVRIPKDHEMYGQGLRYARRYRIRLT